MIYRWCFLSLLVINIPIWSLNRFKYLGYPTPELSASWADGSNLHVIQNSHISGLPIFSFNLNEFKPYFLKNHPHISFRDDPEKCVSTNLLEKLLDEAIHEIKAHKKKLTHFVILQKKNFNWRHCCGLLVLKYKKYPFVVKLFIENPKTFTNPYCKGIEPICLFYMGSGASRHLTGLLRIKNLVNINKQIQTMDRWKDNVETPNKWLHILKNSRWMHIKGKHIDGIAHQEIKLPEMYALFADYIKDDGIKIPSKLKKNIIIQLCNDLDLAIDPHDNNYIFCVDKKQKKLKMVIIDTEHFPTMVGIKQKKQFKNYTQWYLHLAWKCFEDTYLFPKEKRIARCTKPLSVGNILPDQLYS